MSDELLGKAARALREAGDLDEQEAALVRARILSTVADRNRKRARKLTLLLPLAAVLVGTTALAATNEGFSRAVRSFVASLVDADDDSAGTEAIESAPARPNRRVDPPREPEVELAMEEAPSAAEAEPLPEPVVEMPAPPAPPSTTRETPRAADPEPEPAPPPEAAPHPADLARFERAYKLHFIDKDYEHALLAWEGYLRTSPGGPLAIEARYNRAMALVRLGRNEEARSALEPFARGAFGGYRQNEAQAILSALP